MRFIFIVIFISIFNLGVKSQVKVKNTEGSVSFLSSKSVYVKYSSTDGILVGDTLYAIQSNNTLKAALIVKNLSSTSVVAVPITSDAIIVNDKIIAKKRIKKVKKKKIKKDTIVYAADTVTEKYIDKAKKQIISGRIAISNYSNFSNTPAKNAYVTNYALSLNIKNIDNSKLSLESNVLFRQENNKWNDVKKDIFNGLKIYDLALNYQLNKTTLISFGRKINPFLSSLGSIDGLQVEKKFNHFYVGGFLGTRPDFMNYAFDFDLPQGGFYIGHNLHTKKGRMSNSLAVINQTNNFKTDRRFINFQHRNSLVKNLYLYYTLEVDLYETLNQQKANVLSLTNNYLSIRYQPFKRIRLSGTYETRKNIIYYETFKSYINTLIANELRQGVSARINYKISKSLSTGVRVGYRFQNRDINATENAYAFFTDNNIFKSLISGTLSATMLKTNYLIGNIYNIRFSRPFGNGKTNVSLAYSFIDYKVVKAEFPLRQNITDINISRALKNKLYLSVNLESNFEGLNKFYRIYARISKRF